MMKYICIFLLFFIASSCNKKDLHAYKHYVKKNPCVAIAFNADRQHTNDFYMVKTFDVNRILTHINTQLKDAEGITYVYDYDISYEGNKATFKGTTTPIRWDLDHPEEWQRIGVEDPMVHPVELTGETDQRGFTVTLDPKTGHAIQATYNGKSYPDLELRYSKQDFLDHAIVNYYFETDYPFSLDYKVTTDEEGNILTAYIRDEFNEVMGLRYHYNDQLQETLKHFYEPTNIFIHPLYSLLEVLDWGPFQPTKQRIFAEIETSFYFPGMDFNNLITAEYINHTYDEKGNLTGYTFTGEFTKAWGDLDWAFRGQRQQTIQWSCVGKKVK